MGFAMTMISMLVDDYNVVDDHDQDDHDDHDVKKAGDDEA